MFSSTHIWGSILVALCERLHKLQISAAQRSPAPALQVACSAMQARVPQREIARSSRLLPCWHSAQHKAREYRELCTELEHLQDSGAATGMVKAATDMVGHTLTLITYKLA